MALEPAPIQKLKQDVINRIAAGEVIQRPANALKELIENSMDAKSTNIQITVKEGGLRLLQIQDNGTGIRKEDFEIVCERFTTSKLREFEDLQKISTYGFRGEALASISHVAHLSIVSKTKKDVCAYQADFSDSKLKAPPKPVAGNQGTIITVEDLFYNMTVRKKALRSPAEEYQKIADVVGKYAIHNATVGFALKKFGGNNDIRTPVNSNHTENIGIVYGTSIARELIDFNIENDTLKFTAKGYMTTVNYSTKKFQFLLFINHRLVDCQSLKKCIDIVYQTYLPKNLHPFVYLSLELDPNNIDVNIHPTKHEVHFLNESQVIESITTALEQKLLGSNNSRAFYMQSKLPNLRFETKEILKDRDTTKTGPDPKYVVRTNSNVQKLEKFFGETVRKSETVNSKGKEKENLNLSVTEDEYNKHHELFLKEQEKFEDECLSKTVEDDDDVVLLEGSPEKASKESPKLTEACPLNPEINLVLDERKNLSLDMSGTSETYAKESAFRHGPSTAENNRDAEKNGENNQEMSVKAQVFEAQEAKKCERPLSQHLIKKITKTPTSLTSVLQLRMAVEENCHRTLRETFSQHVFVGAISPEKALIQYSTQLLLCNTNVILEELFYQLILYNFQNFKRYRFDNPLPIKELALIGLDLPEVEWTEEDGPKEELSQRIVEILVEKGPMIDEYFSVGISKDGILNTMPILLENYIPDPIGYPMYLIRLATEVNWEKEKKCFDSFARETAKFYSRVSSEVDENGKNWQWVTEHVLYPAVKEYFIPPKRFAENAAILEIANLPNLYKVFERC